MISSTEKSDIASLESSILSRSHVKDLAQMLATNEVSRNLWHTLSIQNWQNVLNGWIQSPFDHCIVACNETGQAIGIVRIKQWRHKKRNHCGWIGPIAVNPGYWRMGVGSKLLNDSCTLCKKIGIIRVELSVQEDSTIIKRLAVKNQFTCESIQLKAINKTGGNILAMIVYVKFL